ncbi:MAG: hypothetical protein AB1629_04350 [Candidatus Omnitrophota bacterium]
MMKKIGILVFFLLFLSSLAFAETIKLKSGKTVEAPIIEKTDKHIRVDIAGVKVSYFLDEIESIGGKDPQLTESAKEENMQLSGQYPEKVYYTEPEYSNERKGGSPRFKMSIDLTLAIPFLLIYGVGLLLGLFLRFSFQGMMILIAGDIITSFIAAFLRNQALAMITTFICGIVCLYFFIEKEAG